MTPLRPDWSRRARKDLRKLDAQAAHRVGQVVARFCETGHGDVTKLTDVEPAEYRLRVGDWRVRFARDDQARVLSVLRVRPRGKAYDR